MIGLFSALIEKLLVLDQQLAASTSHGFAKTTAHGLRSKIEKYVKFCTEYGLYLFNADVLQVRRYLQYLTKSHGSIQSMKGYVSGARTLFELAGFEPPPWDDYLYQLMVRGITRDKGHVVKQAQPVTPKLLVDIYPYVEMRQTLDLVAWVGTLLGFYMFLRKMNLFPDTLDGFSPSIQLGRCNLYQIGDMFLVRVYHTKTIQYMERRLDIPILPNPDLRICPVYWLKHMLQQVPGCPKDPVPGRLVGGKVVPLTYVQWTKVFRGWLAKAGYQDSLYSSHSLRRGAPVGLQPVKLSLMPSRSWGTGTPQPITGTLT